MISLVFGTTPHRKMIVLAVIYSKQELFLFERGRRVNWWRFWQSFYFHYCSHAAAFLVLLPPPAWWYDDVRVEVDAAVCWSLWKVLISTSGSSSVSLLLCISDDSSEDSELYVLCWADTFEKYSTFDRFEIEAAIDERVDDDVAEVSLSLIVNGGRCICNLAEVLPRLGVAVDLSESLRWGVFRSTELCLDEGLMAGKKQCLRSLFDVEDGRRGELILLSIFNTR